MKKKINCVFCNKTKEEVNKMIMGKTANGIVNCICDACIDICTDALKNNILNEKKISIPTPKEIFAKLNNMVEGQIEAKKHLSIAAYNHYKRISVCNKDIEKSNILLIGPSGSGKTLLVKTLSQIMGVPFSMVDCTTITAAGYVGNDVDIALTGLMQASNFDINKAQKGIVFLDEIDKIRTKGQDRDSTVKDISGEGAQQALLRMLEGSIVQIPINQSKRNTQEFINFDTTNTLFICAGVFEGLEKIIEKDINTSNTFFVDIKKNKNSYNKTMENLTVEHLAKYGMLYELLGRLPIKTVFNELTEDDLYNILTRPQNAILKQFRDLFLIKDNVKLIWTPASVREMAKQAIATKTYARALRSIIEKLLQNIMFILPELKNKTVKIDYDGEKLYTLILEEDTNIQEEQLQERLSIL